MRTRSSLVVSVLLFVSLATVARANSGDVYNDFASDGVLSCSHSRSDLKAVLRSGSLNQYADPYTLARLKLAVRRQLAGTCRARASSGQGSGTSGQRSTRRRTAAKGSAAGGRHENSRRKGKSGVRPRSGASRSLASAATASAGNSRFIWSRVLLAALVVAAVAASGWVTTRALAGRS